MSGLKAQVILVNPDGTHSIIIDNGTTKTVVNPKKKNKSRVNKALFQANR